MTGRPRPTPDDLPPGDVVKWIGPNRFLVAPRQDIGEAPRSEIERLTDEAARGDQHAVAELLTQIRPLVVQYCRARLSEDAQPVSADDVAQEVCLFVLTGLPSHGKSSFLAFVYGVASHKVIDAHRFNSVLRAGPVADVPELPVTEAGPEEQVLGELENVRWGKRLAKLLGELPEEQRVILVLSVAQDRSVSEVAEALHWAPGAVASARARALRRLRLSLSLDDEVDWAITMSGSGSWEGSFSRPTMLVATPTPMVIEDAESAEEEVGAHQASDTRPDRVRASVINALTAGLNVAAGLEEIRTTAVRRRLTEMLTRGLDLEGGRAEVRSHIAARTNKTGTGE